MVENGEEPGKGGRWEDRVGQMERRHKGRKDTDNSNIYKTDSCCLYQLVQLCFWIQGSGLALYPSGPRPTREMQTHHHHPSDPEKENVVACLQDLGFRVQHRVNIEVVVVKIAHTG